MAWQWKMEWKHSFFKIPFTLYKSPTLPPPKHPQTITLPPPCLTDGVKHSSNIFSFFLHLTNILLCDPNLSNFDSSVHNTFSNLPLSSVILPILICYFYWPAWDMYFFATLPRRPASQLRLFTVAVETAVLWVLFNEAANWGLVRHLFLKLDTLIYLFSRCSLKGVVHSVVRDLQFLGNFSHGIAFISQNKNRLTSFRRKSLFLAISSL